MTNQAQNWQNMSDKELKRAIRTIILKCLNLYGNKDNVQQMLKDEIGYEYTVAVNYIYDQKMGYNVQFMAWNENGKIIR